MTDREQNILRGGSEVVYCISICLDAICACNEVGDGSGNFPTSSGTSSSTTSTTEKGVSIAVSKM